MSKKINAGVATAYGAYLRGGGEMTYEEFCAALADLGVVLEDLENLSVTCETLAAGSSATVSYTDGVIHFGIPKGDKGDKGDKGNTGNTPNISIGTVTTGAAGSSAAATMTGTADNPVLNLTIPQGVPGEMTAASVAPVYSSSATYAVGDYCTHDGQLYRCTTAISTAEAWTAAHWTAAAMATDVGTLKSAFINEDYYNLIPVEKDGTRNTAGITASKVNGVYTFSGTASANYTWDIIGSTSALPDNVAVGDVLFVDSGINTDKLQIRIYGDSTSNELLRLTSVKPKAFFTVPSGYSGIFFRWYIAKNTAISSPVSAKPTVSKVFSNAKLQNSIYNQQALTFVSGYIDGYGVLQPAGSTNLEVMSYPIYGVTEFQLDMTFASSKNHAITMIGFSADGTFIGATQFDGTTNSASSTYCDAKASISPDVAYIIIYFRTFGEAYTISFKPIANAASLANQFSRHRNDMAQYNLGEIERNKVRSSVGANIMRFDKYIDHLFSDGANGTSVKVPWESLIHVRLSKRMGFNCIEGNVHQLSDGSYLVIHGSTSNGEGTFGNSVYHIDGETDISAVAFSSVTMDWVKTNVRYKCTVDKYKVAPPSLQEFLYECKILGMIPFIQAVSGDFNELKPEIDILNEIMGNGNYILYVRPDGGNDAIRQYTSAPMARWSNLATKDDIIAWVQKMNPCIYGMSNYSDFTDEQLTEIINGVHENNGLIDSAYLTEADRIRLMRLGFDFISTKYCVNRIDSGNLCNLTADLAFDDFTTTGTVSNNILLLAANDTITPNATLNTEYISGGCLDIVFDGKISLSMGDFIDDVVITSDGTEVIPISTYFINAAPTFTITAVESTEVSMLVYKASKF